MQKVLLHQGMMEVDNVTGFHPFTLHFEDIGHNSIQVDVLGSGCLNYVGKLNRDLELEIHTNILKTLKHYSECTGHSSADIGYSLTLKDTKRYNRTYHVDEAEISLTIIFKKPVDGVSAYSLQPTIDLISTNILGEIFIMRN